MSGSTGRPPAGAYLIDKPAGLTSHDVVRQVRRAVGLRAVGHTGTLDPFATGLLVVLIGKGTRLARFVEQQPKTYWAMARLGVVTDTDDLTGTEVERWEGPLPDAQAIREAFAGFGGEMLQTPPAYSAKRVDGERSHRIARRGGTVSPEPVTVRIDRLEVLEVAGADVTFRTTVSPGTYIRALARDVGRRLGVGAHLTALRREAIGPLRVEEAVTLDDVAAGCPPAPLQRVLAHLPAATLDEEAAVDVSHGRPVEAPAGSEGLTVLCRGGEVLGVAEAADGWLQPRVVLVGQ